MRKVESQDTFNEGVTRGSVRCAQKRNCSRVRVPCRDRSTSPAVYVRVISWRVRFQNGFLYINWAYDAVDRRAIERALARAPDEQREAVMSVLAQEREQGRIEGRAEGKAGTLVRLLERRFHGVPEPYHA